MNQEEEKAAIFWCDLLKEIIFGEISPEEINLHLKKLAKTEVRFPNGCVKKPSLSSLRRKLKKYRNGGFDALSRKGRDDCGKPRSVSQEVMERAIELKKDQPRRSPEAINRFLMDMYGKTVPEKTLYRHLKEAGATRKKLGVCHEKVHKRWTRNHTHDLWLGDFANGPYVLENNQVVPTYLSAFIDCFSRYGVEARYYLRENLDVLADSFLRALSIHGASLEVYVDNAKIYHANAWKSACYRINTNLLHRPPREPESGGCIERFIQTIQDQFESEIRRGPIVNLTDLNRALSAWLHVSYHHRVHSETRQTPHERYQQGLTIIRKVDMQSVLKSFMHSEKRTVNKDFSDVRLENRFFRVDPKLRGDRVEVRFDPFARADIVEIYSLNGQYLGTGQLHHRQEGIPAAEEAKGLAKYSYTDLLIREHQKQLAKQTGAIDFQKAISPDVWPFHELAKTVADLMGRKGGLSALTTQEISALQNVYDQGVLLNRQIVKQAFATAWEKSVPYIVRELNCFIEKEKN